MTRRSPLSRAPLILAIATLSFAPAIAFAAADGAVNNGRMPPPAGNRTAPRLAPGEHAARRSTSPVLRPDTGVDPNMPILRPAVPTRGGVIHPPASGPDGGEPDAR